MAKQTTNSVARRRAQFIASWREHEPQASYAGYTLEQFEAETEKPLTIRTRMDGLRMQLAGIKLERDKADEAFNGITVAVANGVRADPAHGPDSPFYRALGFIPKSERKRPRRPMKPSAQSTPESSDANAD